MQLLLNKLYRLNYFLICIFFSCNQSDRIVHENTSIDENILVELPQKKPLILLTERPYNFETPLHYFLQDFTPNDVFFIRWHLSNLPSAINADTFHLYVNGNVKKPLVLTLKDLKTKFQPVTINALCVCAGNARSLFNPRVAGAQWVNGGMGNAQWTGVKLKDILALADPQQNSKFISFNGMDAPPMSGVPDFVKSLSYSHAIDGEVMIAYQMNGEDIPLLNGFPLKLVVPGWYATYWIGMLNEVKVYADSFHGYWMDKAYQIPKGVTNGNERFDSLAKNTEPINKIDIRSIFVSPEPESILRLGKKYEIQGLAFDGGAGIEKVEISMDKGRTWVSTKLDESLGKYSWRRWRYEFNATEIGKQELLVKATSNNGETQPWHQWNRNGYMRNEIESLQIIVR